MLKEQVDIEIRTSEQRGKRPRNTTNRWGRGSERATYVKEAGQFSLEVFGGASASDHLVTLFRIFLESNFIWVTCEERSD